MNSENNCFADKISNEKLESIILSGMKEQLKQLVNLDMVFRKTEAMQIVQLKSAGHSIRSDFSIICCSNNVTTAHELSRKNGTKKVKKFVA